ncbi:MAG: 23S rRNA (uracil(1939)-C(5))-methyltransferase RlmD [Bacteroidota bacterium]|nr:23S rRNA (uracil(1939)-C(5))-methyltransferase RlmD [Bacteroidota bacterium]
MGKIIEDLTLSGIHSAGKAVGQHNGKNIFVDFGIPGETVEVMLDRRKRGFYCASIDRIKVQSPQRVAPFCQHFGTCGGCNWQHMNYPKQLHLKKLILQNALTKYQIETPEIPDVIPSPSTVHFRNKVEYAFDGEYNTPDSHNYLGFHPFDRRDRVIDIEECWLQREPSRTIYEKIKSIAIDLGLPFYNYEERSGFLRNLIIRTSTTNETLVIIGFCYDDKERRDVLLQRIKGSVSEINSLMFTILSSPEKGFADGEIILHSGGPGFLTEKMDGINYRISPKAFYQPNPAQANVIYQKIVEFGNFSGNEFVYDLYTGAGTIACYIASKVRKILGIEGSPDAITDAFINAQINNLPNTDFICGDVLRTFNNDFVSAREKPDIIILDPPRSGTLIEIKKTIIRASPSKIIYVSCNPVSLAFDLTMLTNGYRVTKIQPIDMFPHTHHVETVVLLEKQ